MKGCANPTVSPAAQDDPTGASEVTNAEGAQQAVWVQLNLIFLVCAHVKKRHRPLDSSQFSILCLVSFHEHVDNVLYILSHLLILSILCICSCYAAKADKKAAQVKILQQEHKRQVCVCACCQAETETLLPCISPHYCVFVFQEREGELRAMARKIRMK